MEAGDVISSQLVICNEDKNRLVKVQILSTKNNLSLINKKKHKHDNE